MAGVKRPQARIVGSARARDATAKAGAEVRLSRIVECWNTFGDLGGAARSSNQKVAAAMATAVAMGGDEGPYEVGLCWVVRDTKQNRAIVAMYGHIFEARFPGSSQAWVKALTEPGATMPTEPGLVWCDLRGTRLFAHRRQTAPR